MKKILLKENEFQLLCGYEHYDFVTFIKGKIHVNKDSGKFFCTIGEYVSAGYENTAIAIGNAIKEYLELAMKRRDNIKKDGECLKE